MPPINRNSPHYPSFNPREELAQKILSEIEKLKSTKRFAPMQKGLEELKSQLAELEKQTENPKAKGDLFQAIRICSQLLEKQKDSAIWIREVSYRMKEVLEHVQKAISS